MVVIVLSMFKTFLRSEKVEISNCLRVQAHKLMQVTEDDEITVWKHNK